MRKLMFLIALALVAVPSALANTGSASSPAQRCAAERTAIGTPAFNLLYGTNANKSNAFGKCVSKLARAETLATNAATAACTAEQNDAAFPATHGGKTFAQFYGTGKKGNNAFRKCVSTKVSAAAAALDTATINAARACKTERTANPVAFKTKYGTNPNKSNAFGKCVSLKVHA